MGVLIFKLPVQLRLDTDFYEENLKNLRKDRLLSGFIVELLELYYSDESVRDAYLKFKHQDTDHGAINTIIKILEGVEQNQLKIRGMCKDAEDVADGVLADRVGILETKLDQVLEMLTSGVVAPAGITSGVTVSESKEEKPGVWDSSGPYIPGMNSVLVGLTSIEEQESVGVVVPEKFKEPKVIEEPKVEEESVVGTSKVKSEDVSVEVEREVQSSISDGGLMGGVKEVPKKKGPRGLSRLVGSIN